MRDDFNAETKKLLANRVGNRCSNPNCRRATSGPQEEPTKSLNIGVAAHIRAASPGGPRYNENMSSEDRKSINNGIWLCQNCAKLVDNDAKRYSVDILIEWRKLSEKAALFDIKNPVSEVILSRDEDIELVKFYRQCFDRPAFQDHFMQEMSIEAFDKAIEDTITAINTGNLRARDGTILAQAKGKSYLSSHEWFNKMDTIVDLLRAIRSRYLLAMHTDQIHIGGQHQGRQHRIIHDRELAFWMDGTREQAIGIFSELCKEAGIPPLRFPRTRSGPPFW